MCWCSRPLLPAPMCNQCESRCFNVLARTNNNDFSLQLSAMDVSARTTMKGAAKCDKHCDLQNSVNQQGFERILRFRDTPESMPASVSTLFSCRCFASPSRVVAQALPAVRLCASSVLRLWWQQPLMCEVHLGRPGKQLAEHHKGENRGRMPCVGQHRSAAEHCRCALLVSPRHEVRSANPLNLSI